jgi:hypothetical protein
VEVGGEALLDARPPGLDACGRFGEDFEEPTAHVFEHRDEQRTLRREVLVEDRLGHPCGEREVVHRGGVEPALGELDARDVEQLPSPLVGRETRR